MVVAVGHKQRKELHVGIFQVGQAALQGTNALLHVFKAWLPSPQWRILSSRSRRCRCLCRWRICVLAPTSQGYPAAGPLEALPNELRQPIDAITGQATCLAALSTLQPSQGLPWPNIIVTRNHHYYCLPSEQARRLAEEGNTTQGAHSVYSLALSPCKCKAKTAIVTNTAPEPARLNHTRAV